MIKKTITYEDFNGDTHTEDFYFHLLQNEIVELEFGQKGGFGAYLQAMVKAENQAEIMKAFKEVVSKSFGRRYGDKLEKFRKNPEWTEEFLASNAYDVLFMELVTNEQAAIEFIVGIVPASIAGELDMDAIKNAAKNTVDVKLPETFRVTEQDKNIRPMTDEELAAGQEIPAAFKQPPVDYANKKREEMIDPGAITLPVELQDISREELLRAYDAQMSRKRTSQE